MKVSALESDLRQLLQTPRDALARNAGGTSDRQDATTPQALRFSRR